MEHFTDKFYICKYKYKMTRCIIKKERKKERKKETEFYFCRELTYQRFPTPPLEARGGDPSGSGALYNARGFMIISGLSFLLQFLGCSFGEEEAKTPEQRQEEFVSEQVAKTPEVIASVNFDRDFQDAFINNNPKIKKFCSTPTKYPGYTTEPQGDGDVKITESHWGQPLYEIIGSYGSWFKSRSASIVTDCTTKVHDQNRDYVYWSLRGVDRVEMIKLPGDNREFASASRSLYVNERFYYPTSNTKSASLLVDTFINDFCQAQAQAANPMPCITETRRE